MGSRRPTLTSMDSAVAHHRRACWRYCVRWERPSMTCAGWTRPCGGGGRVPGINLRLPAGLDHSWTCLLHLEDGKTVGWRVDPARLRVQESAQVEGRRYVRRGLVLPGRPPLREHQPT